MGTASTHWRTGIRGNSLTGVMYVFDEPSIGLHQRDNDRLRTAKKQTVAVQLAQIIPAKISNPAGGNDAFVVALGSAGAAFY